MHKGTIGKMHEQCMKQCMNNTPTAIIQVKETLKHFTQQTVIKVQNLHAPLTYNNRDL